MRNAIVINVFIFVSQSYAVETELLGNHVGDKQVSINKSVDELVDKLIDRAFEAMSLHSADLEDTTLAKGPAPVPRMRSLPGSSQLSSPLRFDKVSGKAHWLASRPPNLIQFPSKWIVPTAESDGAKTTKADAELANLLGANTPNAAKEVEQAADDSVADDVLKKIPAVEDKPQRVYQEGDVWSKPTEADSTLADLLAQNEQSAAKDEGVEEAADAARVLIEQAAQADIARNADLQRDVCTDIKAELTETEYATLAEAAKASFKEPDEFIQGMWTEASQAGMSFTNFVKMCKDLTEKLK